jgi:hypothetical protein
MTKAAKYAGTALLSCLLLCASSDLQAQRRHAPAKQQAKTRPAPRRQTAVKQAAAQLPAPAASTPIRRSDTTIRSTSITVYQEYEPELKPVTKPELSPSLPPPSNRKTEQQYDVPQQTLYYSYRALPLRPLALGKDSLRSGPGNYVMLGGGNLSTVLAEAGVASLKGRDWRSAITARFLNQKGGLVGQRLQEYKLGASAEWDLSGPTLTADINAVHRRYGQYGYNQDVYKLQDGDVRRTLDNYGLRLGLKSRQPGVWGLQYHAEAGIDLFKTSVSAAERNIDIHVPVWKQFDSSFSAGIGLHAWLTTISETRLDKTQANNNIFQATPWFEYRQEGFESHVGLSPTIGQNGIAYLLPDVSLGYRFDNDKIRIGAAYKARLQLNSYEELVNTNPFILDITNYQQSRIDDVYGELRLALGHHLSVWGRAGWMRARNLPVFLVQQGGTDDRWQVSMYDGNVEAITWSGGVRYAVAEDLSLGISGNWYSFYKKTYDHVYGQPGVRLRGDISWRIIRDLRLTAYTSVLDQIWSRDYKGGDVRLKGVFDIGLSGEYTFADRFDLFLRAENLLNRANERWLGYPSFGFNIYGGLRFRF